MVNWYLSLQTMRSMIQLKLAFMYSRNAGRFHSGRLRIENKMKRKKKLHTKITLKLKSSHFLNWINVYLLNEKKKSFLLQNKIDYLNYICLSTIYKSLRRCIWRIKRFTSPRSISSHPYNNQFAWNITITKNQLVLKKAQFWEGE